MYLNLLIYILEIRVRYYKFSVAIIEARTTKTTALYWYRKLSELVQAVLCCRGLPKLLTAVIS